MNNLVPLTLVALEIGGDASVLAVKLGDAVELDTAGFRCVPTDTARQIITEHRQAVAAEHEHADATVPKPGNAADPSTKASPPPSAPPP
jgi:hypothetical protein